MPHRILLTGASGYLGGSLLAAIGDANLPIYDKLYALVRTDAQAEAVKKYAAEPLNFDVKDEAAVRSAVVGHKITVVFFLIDAMSAVSQGFFIKSLAEVRSSTGEEVHFLHVRSPEHNYTDKALSRPPCLTAILYRPPAPNSSPATLEHPQTGCY